MATGGYCLQDYTKGVCLYTATGRMYTLLLLDYRLLCLLARQISQTTPVCTFLRRCAAITSWSGRSRFLAQFTLQT